MQAQIQTRSAVIAKVSVTTALIFFMATVGGFAAVSGMAIVKKNMKLKPAPPTTYACGAGLNTADYIVTPIPSAPFEYTLPSLALDEAQITGDRDGDGTIKICLRGGASTTSPNIYSEPSTVSVNFAPWSVTNGTGNEPVYIFSDLPAEKTYWVNPTRRLLVLSNSEISSTRQVTISSIGFVQGVGVLDTVMWQAPNSRLSFYRSIFSDHIQVLMFIGGASNFSIEKSVIQGNTDGMWVYGTARVALTQNEWTSNTTMTSGRGGAIWAREQAVITDVGSIYRTNEAGEGGAIFLDEQTSYTGTSSQFVGNKATAGSIAYGGGAMTVLDEAGFQCDQCVWQDNSAEYSQGGAIAIHSAKPHAFFQNSFERNVSTKGGAIMSSAGADLVFQGGQFVENVATQWQGGAINASVRWGVPSTSLVPSSMEFNSVQFLRNQSAQNSGGAVYSFPNDSMVVDQGAFEENTASNAGALMVLEGVVAISNTSFTRNESLESSGAVSFSGYSLPIQVTITSSEFTGNHAKLSAGALSVGNGGVDLAVVSSQFTGNTTQDFGGAIRIVGDVVQVAVNKTSFVGNATTSNVAEGGAIECEAEEGDSLDLEVTGSTFVQNTALYHGGAISSRGCAFEVSSSTFDENTAADGGALAVLNYYNGVGSETDITITDSTFTNNQANVWHGGAISIEDVGGDHVLSGNTFEGNRAEFLGGAIRAFESGPLAITNSTFTSNTSVRDMGGAVNVDGAFESLTMDQIVARDNTSRNNGGFLSARTYGTPAVMNLSHLDVRSNHTDPGYSGGGIYLEGGKAVLTNSLFAQNEVVGSLSPQASAVKTYTTDIDMDYVTIAGNIGGSTAMNTDGGSQNVTANHLLLVNNDGCQFCGQLNAVAHSLFSVVFPQTGIGSWMNQLWSQGVGNTSAPSVLFIGDANGNTDPRTSTSIETFNFHLQPTSPGVDIDSSELDVDGSSADAGAYGGYDGDW